MLDTNHENMTIPIVQGASRHWKALLPNDLRNINLDRGGYTVARGCEKTLDLSQEETCDNGSPCPLSIPTKWSLWNPTSPQISHTTPFATTFRPRRDAPVSRDRRRSPPSSSLAPRFDGLRQRDARDLPGISARSPELGRVHRRLLSSPGGLFRVGGHEFER